MLRACSTRACGIPAILAGILTQLALYSVNLRIMGFGTSGGKASLPVSVDKYGLLVSARYVRNVALNNPILILTIFCAVLIAVLYWFFGTELGCSLRATGANQNMARAQGINTNVTKVLGLMISNGLVALAGGLLAQYQGFCRHQHGPWCYRHRSGGRHHRRGASSAVSSATLPSSCCPPCIGAIIYYIVMVFVLRLGLSTDDLKLLTALVVALFLTIPVLEGQILHQDLGEKGGEEPCLRSKTSTRPSTPAPSTKRWPCNGLNLTLEDGDFVTVIGGNGAGKSTMLNAVAGVWPVDMGKILIDGQDVTRLSEHQRAKYIGRVFQDPMMGTAATMGIEENLALAARRGVTPLAESGHHQSRARGIPRAAAKRWTWAWRTA